MSEQTISEKSRQIREETAKYANTRGRVADVLDDINETKANKEDLDTAINDTLTPLVERVNAVEQSNTTQDTAIAGKLDKTTTTISEPNAEFKYAYLTNEGNETRRMLAGDLGKNVANSKPTSVAGAGLNMGAIWEIETNNFPLRIKGLPDKSADTTFSRLMVQNADRQNAWSNGSNILKAMPSLLSEAEKTAWKTEMNGGWTTNTMSVAVISPTVFKRINEITYVGLKGANLNLNPSSFKVQILDNTGNSVLAEVPNNQVQLYENGTDLIFYYNFHHLGIGEFKIRLWNGVAHYTTQSISIVDNVNYINLSDNVWEQITPNGVVNDNVLSDIRNVSFILDPDVKPYANDNTYVLAMKSKEFTNMSKDFFIEFTYSMYRSSSNSQYMFGLSLVDENNLSNNISWGIRSVSAENSADIATGTAFATPSNSIHTFSIYKKGNVITTNIRTNTGVNITKIHAGVTIDANTKVYLKGLLGNGQDNQRKFTIQILDAYTID